MKSSVAGDWLAGCELLRAAVATSARNVRINVKADSNGTAGSDCARRNNGDKETSVLLNELATLERRCGDALTQVGVISAFEAAGHK